MAWSRRKIGIVSLLGALVIVTAFQNCGPSSSGSLYPTPEERVAQMAKALPFAYDAVLDNFAYMSCAIPQGNASASTFFTFKMGAYGNGGLGLNYSASSYLTSKVARADRLSVFQASPANESIVPQLDIRSKFNLLGPSVQAQTSARGLTFDYMLDYLQLSWIAEGLINSPPGTYIKQAEDPYTKYITKMQGQLTYYRDDASLAALRNSFSVDNGNLLALTFTQADNRGGGLPAMPPTVTVDKESYRKVIYGRGFRPVFTAPGGANGVWGQRLVSSLEERTLEYDTHVLSAAGGWTCEPDLQFMIIRRADLNKDINVYMHGNGYTAPRTLQLSSDQDGGNADRMRLIRNLLPEDRWIVDIPNRLIAPKKVEDGSCYQGEQSVQYNIAQGDCDTGSPGGNLFKACAHFVSLCYRN